METSQERAGFASTTRLISCLVTESLVNALYYPIRGFDAKGFCIVLTKDLPVDKSLITFHDVLSVILLRDVPILKHDDMGIQTREIALLDPMDIMMPALELSPDQSVGAILVAGRRDTNRKLFDTIQKTLSCHNWTLNESAILYVSQGPLSIWDKYAKSVDVDTKISKEIGEELANGVKWQVFSYEHPPSIPLFEDASIVWEQSIVEGHPTHPLYKMRQFFFPISDFEPGSYDLYHPRLRLVAVPRSELKITYDFEELTRGILDTASKTAGISIVAPEDHVVIPVHELQVKHIESKFPNVHIFPGQFSIPSLAQQSIRSVVVPGVYRDLSLKLALGIKLTSVIRTIFPATAYFGPRFSAKVVPALTIDSNILIVAKELASVVHASSGWDTAHHCAAIIREAHENTSEEQGERHIVCTALVERGHAGANGHVPALIRVFDLHTEEQRVEWLDNYVCMLFAAFLPPVMHNGVTFECHQQNCIARFDIRTKALKGFIIRDLGGVRVHAETLRKSTGVEVEYLVGDDVIASELEDVYKRTYHTLIHNHLQQFIRVLGLHYNGKGWAIVRRHLVASIPKNHPLYAAWLVPEKKTLLGKCFLRMRISGLWSVEEPFFNLIHYRGVTAVHEEEYLHTIS